MPTQQFSPIIKGLIPGLTERGKIKIGMKGETRKSAKGGTYQLPQKIDHFLITTLERDEDDNFKKDVAIHKELGTKPKRLPVRLLFDDISLNFQCRYTCYNGRTLFCHGDGENASRLGNNSKRKIVSCPCERKEKDYKGENGDGKGACKINGTLSVLIDCEAASIGGVWKFRTTGYNSTAGILGSLQLIYSITGGLLAGIPFDMVVSPKIATANDKPVTVYVVGLEYKGNVEQLRRISLDMAQDAANHYARMKQVETTAKDLIAYEQSLVEESGDIVPEFHPEETVQEVGDPEYSEKPEEDTGDAVDTGKAVDNVEPDNVGEEQAEEKQKPPVKAKTELKKTEESPVDNANEIDFSF